MKAETVTSCTASAPEMPDFLENNELDQILTQITDHELNQICYPENVITKPAEVVPLRNTCTVDAFGKLCAECAKFIQLL